MQVVVMMSVEMVIGRWFRPSLPNFQLYDLTYCNNLITETYCRIWGWQYLSTLHCSERKSRSPPPGYSSPNGLGGV